MLLRICFFLTLFSASQAQAGLEVGLGMSVINVPHYIGSNESELYYLPFPYLRYRSETINIDRNLIQTKLWRHGNWSLELSLGGSIKVDSEKNQARAGMDDLDFIIELGPALHYYFLGSRKDDNALFLEFPLRGAISTDFTQATDRGVSFNPRLVWRRGYMIDQYEVRPQMSVGLRSASDSYHNYLYGVDSQFVRADRSEYKGTGGYGGWQLGYSTAVLWSDWLVAGFVRYVNINEAVYADSPLVKTNNSVVFGLASAYLF
jgi:outer membrane protein